MTFKTEHPELPADLKEYLEEKTAYYNQPWFVAQDPVSIPRRFSKKEDIEIAGFLAATISWGNRKAILQNADKLMRLMGSSPFDFVMSCTPQQLKKVNFVHRTFNGEDLHYFLTALRHIYLLHGGMETVFQKHALPADLQSSISRFRDLFFSIPHPQRTRKHVSDPESGSPAKRINMMLRWFVRNDNKGVDLGIWKSLNPAQLSCPLDVHSGRIARELGLLTRGQNDAKAVAELDRILRKMDPEDPVKFDFALFGIGVSQHRHSSG